MIIYYIAIKFGLDNKFQEDVKLPELYYF